MNRIERRNFIQGVGFAAGAAAAATFVERPALAQTAVPTGARPVTYEAKPLSLDPKAIKGISEKVLLSHYENNYVGAVKRLTAISTQLAELDFAKAPNFVVNGLKREELIAANSMILHEIYFDSLGGGAAPGGALAQAIARDFGSLDRWRTEFTASPYLSPAVRSPSKPKSLGGLGPMSKPHSLRPDCPGSNSNPHSRIYRRHNHVYGHGSHTRAQR